MLDTLIAPLLTIAFGALAGGLTNTIAIWMLFHPYEAPRIGRWTVRFFQGAVPKNQPRLAAAIGRTVGGKLLTESDLTKIFADEDFRRAFDDRLTDFVDLLLHEERGSLRELLPEAILPEIEALLDQTVEQALERLAAYLDTQDFVTMVEERTERLVETVADEPVGGVLTPAREAALSSALDEWIETAVGSDEFYAAVDDYLTRGAESLLSPERTFEETLPIGLVGAVEKAIAGYLPLAIERLGSLLDDPEARARFERTINEVLHRFLQDLRFHQRVVARLVMTEETVDKVLDTIQEEGADRLSDMLRDPAVQSAMSRGVNDAIVDFLRRPVASVLGEADDPSLVEARETLSGWIVSTARDPATRTFLAEKLEAALDKAGARTWGEVLERVPRDKIALGLVSIAQSEVAQKLLREGCHRLTEVVLDRPIGTPSRWLPEGGAGRLEEGLSEPVWEWLQTQVPAVVQQIDVARRVEEKVLDFPTPRMEELVRKVTERELRLIVQLGYVLGAMIGTVLVVLNRFVG